MHRDDLRTAFSTEGRVPDDDLTSAAEGVIIRINVHGSGLLVLTVEVPALEGVEQWVHVQEMDRGVVYRTDLTVALGTLMEGVDCLPSAESGGTGNVVVR